MSQDELAELALEMDCELKAGTYRATSDELRKLDEAVALLAVAKWPPPTKWMWYSQNIAACEAGLSRLALAELDDIPSYIAERSPLGGPRRGADAARARIAQHPMAAERVEQRPDPAASARELSLRDSFAK